MKLTNTFLMILAILPACAQSSSGSEPIETESKPKPSEVRIQNDDYDTDEDSVQDRARIQEDIDEVIYVEEAPDCIEADDFICDIELEILRQTNEFRKGLNLKPFVNSARVGWVSRDWSLKQADSGRIGHSGFPNLRSILFQEKFDRRVSLRAENVAYNFANGNNASTIAKMFMDMWTNSPGHRANMVAGHKYLGVGVAKTSQGSYYATQIFAQTD